MQNAAPEESSKTSTPQGPQALEASANDVHMIARIKAIWGSHQGDPTVAEALRAALKDGQVTAEEMKSIEASAAFAVAQKTKDSQAFEKIEDDPQLLEEALYLRKILDKDCLAAMALDDIIKDGKVTRDEMRAFAKAYLAPEDKNTLVRAADADKRKEEQRLQESRKRLLGIPIPNAPKPKLPWQ